MDTHSHEDLAAFLRCLIYDLYVLSTAIERLRAAERFGEVEVLKTSGLIKLRAVSCPFHAAQLAVRSVFVVDGKASEPSGPRVPISFISCMPAVSEYSA